MIIIQGEARFGAKDIPAFLKAAQDMIRATRREPGCLHYAYAEDLLEPGLFRISERWTDQAAVDAHMKSAHMTEFAGVLGTLEVLALRVTAFDGDKERILMGG